MVARGNGKMEEAGACRIPVQLSYRVVPEIQVVVEQVGHEQGSDRIFPSQISAQPHQRGLRDAAGF